MLKSSRACVLGGLGFSTTVFDICTGLQQQTLLTRA